MRTGSLKITRFAGDELGAEKRSRVSHGKASCTRCQVSQDVHAGPATESVQLDDVDPALQSELLDDADWISTCAHERLNIRNL